MIPSVSSATPSKALLDSVNGTAAAKPTTAADAQDRFLKLLVTQMKNQDPLNPLDNAQITSQLAQLSTVTGIDKMNETLNSMVAGNQADDSYKAAAMIGHAVMVPGSSIDLSQGTGLMGFQLPQAADTVTLNVRDASGNLVRSLNLGAQGAGSVPVGWDGKDSAGNTLADGKYSFDISATNGGAKVDATLMSVGEVSSVSVGPGGVKLNLRGMNAVAMSDVRQII